MQFEYYFLAAIWLLLISRNEGRKELTTNRGSEEIVNNTLLSAGVYVKLFAERRIEQQIMIRKMLASENYEKNFKLLQLAYEKIFEGIGEKNITLTTSGYEGPRVRFPESGELQGAVTFILENCCIAAESLLHFPEISYRIFIQKKFLKWKTILNWCNEFVNALTHLIDESTVKLMDLLRQEINEDQRTPDYVNPYYVISRNDELRKLKKQSKKLKKGPSLSGGKTEL